jgi:DNA segregation ATPase FtsK/SpoIIIE-like protein
VLEDFGIKGEIIHVRPGPVVTLYEFEPAPGVKSSRVIGLADDIARSMSALSARVAVVPGRNVIGIELPNALRETVYFREMIESQISRRAASSWRSASARRSAASPSSPNSRRCRICWSPAPPARASRSPSTR